MLWVGQSFVDFNIFYTDFPAWKAELALYKVIIFIFYLYISITSQISAVFA